MTNPPPFHNSDNETKGLRQRIIELQTFILRETEIRIRAASYHLETELFDLSLPGFYWREGVWMPAGHYMSDSQKFAREQRKRCIDGLSPGEIKKFQLYIREYANYSVDRLKFELEELQKDNFMTKHTIEIFRKENSILGYGWINLPYAESEVLDKIAELCNKEGKKVYKHLIRYEDENISKTEFYRPFANESLKIPLCDKVVYCDVWLQ